MKNENQPHAIPLKCKAKTRAGTLCNAYVVRNKKRCRLHGGAPGSGAPLGNNNALKHGMYSRRSYEQFAEFKQLISESNKTIKTLKEII